MKITLTSNHPKRRISRPYLEKKIKKIIRILGDSKKDLSFLFTTDKHIAGLNKTFLKKSGPTDVLSFPFHSKEILGEIVISLDTAAQQAKKYGVGLHEQCLVLIIHGMLHLKGFDHDTHKKEKVMREKEKILMQVILGKRVPYL